MKRAALLVLTLALVLPLTAFFAEPPAFAGPCQDMCQQQSFQCTQSCQGGPGGAACRNQCSLDYQACIAACP
jgi:hypothetical protein